MKARAWVFASLMLVACKGRDDAAIARVGDVELRKAEQGVVLRRHEQEIALPEQEPRQVGIAPAGPGSPDVLVFVDRFGKVDEPAAEERGRTTVYEIGPESFELRELHAYAGHEGYALAAALTDIDDDGRFDIELQKLHVSSMSAGRSSGDEYFRFDPATRRFDPQPETRVQHGDEVREDVKARCTKFLGAESIFMEHQPLSWPKHYFRHVGNHSAGLCATAGGEQALVAIRENRLHGTRAVVSIVAAGQDSGEDDGNLSVHAWSPGGRTVAAVVRYEQDGKLFVRAYPWEGDKFGSPGQPVPTSAGSCPVVRIWAQAEPKLVVDECKEEEPPPTVE